MDSVWRWNEVVCMGLHNARGGVLGYDGTFVLLGCYVCLLGWRGCCCCVWSCDAAKVRSGVGVDVVLPSGDCWGCVLGAASVQAAADLDEDWVAVEVDLGVWGVGVDLGRSVVVDLKKGVGVDSVGRRRERRV